MYNFSQSNETVFKITDNFPKIKFNRKILHITSMNNRKYNILRLK